jgi:hypothetical protein
MNKDGKSSSICGMESENAPRSSEKKEISNGLESKYMILFRCNLYIHMACFNGVDMDFGENPIQCFQLTSFMMEFVYYLFIFDSNELDCTI